MISNSVTHLRSYTNSAIAGNSVPISPVTPRDHRRRRAERRRLRMIASSDDVSASSNDVSTSSTDIVASNDLRAIADIAAPNADVSTSSADIVASNDVSFMMFLNLLSLS